MRLKHFDYISLVMRSYKEKRESNCLSLLLAQPTPSKIKKECWNVYKERYDKKEAEAFRKDEQVLRAFFGPSEHGRSFMHLIRDFDTDKFRPLDNYLKGNTENTEDKNLELLAWLIDFEHRPYSFDKNILLTDRELSIVNGENETGFEILPEEMGMEEKKQDAETFFETKAPDTEFKNKKSLVSRLDSFLENGRTKRKPRKEVVIFLILALCSTVIYLIWIGNSETNCMYWTGDHYEAVPCNENSKIGLILPVDEKKMKNFKRITQEDTITEQSIGKIYYIKKNNLMEYYTAGGNHPVRITDTLKVLSQYIFDNHLRK